MFEFVLNINLVCLMSNYITLVINVEMLLDAKYNLYYVMSK